MRGRRLGLDAHPLRVRLGDDADPLRLGLGRLDHLGDELALAQFRLLAGQFGLGRDDLHLRLRLGERSHLRGLRLRLVDLGLVLCLHHRRLPGVLGLLALGFLLCLGGLLVGLRLRDLRLALDRGVVRGGHGVDVAGVHVVDRLDLQRVDAEADLGHLRFGAVEDLGGQFLPFGDDLLDRHGADDRAQVAGEDAAGEGGHLVLVGQEALARVDDALVVVADLERDDGPDVQRDALPGDTGLGHLGLAHRQGEVAGLAEERHHERAVADHDPKWCADGAPPAPATGDQHGLVGGGNTVTKHRHAPQWGLSVRGPSGSAHSLTSTVRAPRLSMTSTDAPLGIGSVDQAR